MEQLVITGPTKLTGTVTVSGAKNAALPIIAASILIKGVTHLSNVPAIKDVLTLLEIMEGLGAKIDFTENELTIDTTDLDSSTPDPELVKRLRASLLLVAPLLSRNGAVYIPHPGGCLIGARPFDVHILALEKMGAGIASDPLGYGLKAKELSGQNTCAEFSVTGTESIIMAAVLAKGETLITLAAAEPHVVDLCHFLSKAGAKISGIGTHTLTIVGVPSLKPVSHTIIPDQIESGTFAIAAAATKGQVTIKGFLAADHQSLLSKFDRIGIRYQIESESTLTVLPSYNMTSFKLRTEIYPGFPTDLQAPMAVLATQADGSSEIYETIFEGRLGYVSELSKMGASCVVRDAHQATITGPTPLHGARITSFDLRAGATLLIAAMIAQGESRLDQIEIIDRGYEKIEDKFRSLGAKIRRVKLQEIE